MMKTRTTITVETWQTTSLRRMRTTTFAWCPVCEADTETLSPVEAAGRLDMSEREIFCLIAIGKLHIVETAGRVARICAVTLEENL